MKISCIKREEDNKSFTLFEKMGFHVIKLKEPELIDKKIESLVSQNYDTIILSNEIAGFSEDIIKKYKNDNNINIIIGRSK